jgi:lambda family phage tail tape measure protein
MAAPNNTIGIVITGDATKLDAAIKQALAQLNDMGVKATVQADRTARAMSEATAKAARQSTWQTLQLYQQLQDFGVQMAGGQNPLLALVQQGSQLTAIYGSAGAAMRAAVGAVVSPAALATAAVAALGFAFLKGDQQSAELRKAMALTGNAAGQTAGSFEALAQAVTKATGESAGRVRDFAQALATTGRFGSAGLAEMTDMAVRMSALTGKSVQETAQSMARLQDAPGAWAAESNKQLNFLTSAQLRYIQQLEAFGKREEAVAKVREALAPRLAQKVTENLGLLERAAKSVTGTFSAMWNAVLGFGRDETTEQQIERLRKVIAGQTNRLTPDNNRAPQIAEARRQLAALLAEQRENEDVARAKEDQATKNRRDEDQRALRERTRASGESLGAARLEVAERAELRRIEAERAALARESLGQENLTLQAYYAQRTVVLDMEEAEARRARVRAQLVQNQARAVSGPEDVNAKEQRRIELVSELADINAKANSQYAQGMATVNRLLQQTTSLELEGLDAVIAKRTDAATAANEQRAALDKLIEQQRFENSLIGRTPAISQRLRQERELAQMRERDRNALASQNLDPAELVLQLEMLEERLRRLSIAQAVGRYGAAREQNEQQMKDLEQISSDQLWDRFSRELPTMARMMRVERDHQIRQARELKAFEDRTDPNDPLFEFQRAHLLASLDTIRQNDRQQALEQTMELYDAQTGYNAALRDWGRQAQESGRMAYEATRNVAASLESDLIDTFKNGRLETKRFVDSLINEFLRLQVVRPLMQSIGGGLNLFGGGAQPAAPRSTTVLPTWSDPGGEFAKGGAFDRGGITAFARGGIVNTPTLFAFANGGSFRRGLMGEAGPEAIMPLGRDRQGRLGVRGGAGGSQVVVNITNNAQAEVSTSSSEGADGTKTIEVMISAVKRSIASDLFNRTGDLPKAVRSSLA